MEEESVHGPNKLVVLVPKARNSAIVETKTHV